MWQYFCNPPDLLRHGPQGQFGPTGPGVGGNDRPGPYDPLMLMGDM